MTEPLATLHGWALWHSAEGFYWKNDCGPGISGFYATLLEALDAGPPTEQTEALLDGRGEMG